MAVRKFSQVSRVPGRGPEEQHPAASEVQTLIDIQFDRLPSWLAGWLTG